MLKQVIIFNDLIAKFKLDVAIEAVLLNGSVAVDKATEYSDLDIIVLCQSEHFVSKVIDGITVEIKYTTFENAIKKLNSNPMEVYRYLNSKIEYDNGKMQEIVEYAQNLYDTYRTPRIEKSNIVYWLNSTKLKLLSALKEQDTLHLAYLVSTNTWIVLQGIWAVNEKPIPPSSTLYRKYSELKDIPTDNWFEDLIVGNIENKVKIMLIYIDWIINKLDKGYVEYVENKE